MPEDGLGLSCEKCHYFKRQKRKKTYKSKKGYVFTIRNGEGVYGWCTADGGNNPTPLNKDLALKKIVCGPSKQIVIWGTEKLGVKL